MVSVAILASTCTILLGERPAVMRMSSGIGGEPGCAYSGDEAPAKGDQMVLPASWRQELDQDSELTIVLAPSFANCGDPDFDYHALFRLARERGWAIAFDRSLAETMARFEDAEEASGILLAGDDPVFWRDSSRRVLRPSAVVVNWNGTVQSQMPYEALLGGTSAR